MAVRARRIRESSTNQTEIKPFSVSEIRLQFNELDSSGYPTRKAEIEREVEGFAISPETRDRHLLIQHGRLATLKVGQHVDGTVRRIRPYGIFIDSSTI